MEPFKRVLDVLRFSYTVVGDFSFLVDGGYRMIRMTFLDESGITVSSQKYFRGVCEAEMREDWN